MGFSSTTGLVSFPIDSISIVIVSFRAKKIGGLRVNPTPSGVPVRITVPGNRVVPWDKNEINCLTLNIISEVFDFCMTVPLSVADIFKLLGLGINLGNWTEWTKSIETFSITPLSGR